MTEGEQKAPLTLYEKKHLSLRVTRYLDYTFRGRRIMMAGGPDRKLVVLAAKKRETEI